MEQNLRNSPILSYFLTLIKIMARFWIKINYLIVVNASLAKLIYKWETGYFYYTLHYPGDFNQ